MNYFPELMMCGFAKVPYYSQILESMSTVYKDNNTLLYEMDTDIGGSGSPIYLKDDCRFRLLGINKLAEKPNSSNTITLVTNEMIDVIEEWAI
jgi:V8-like Glu-specific endopeptidase